MTHPILHPDRRATHGRRSEDREVTKIYERCEAVLREMQNTIDRLAAVMAALRRHR